MVFTLSVSGHYVISDAYMDHSPKSMHSQADGYTTSEEWH